jgi:hypothetical protein
VRQTTKWMNQSINESMKLQEYFMRQKTNKFLAISRSVFVLFFNVSTPQTGYKRPGTTCYFRLPTQWSLTDL